MGELVAFGSSRGIEAGFGMAGTTDAMPGCLVETFT